MLKRRSFLTALTGLFALPAMPWRRAIPSLEPDYECLSGKVWLNSQPLSNVRSIEFTDESGQTMLWLPMETSQWYFTHIEC